MAIKAIIFDCFGVLVATAETKLFDAFPDYREQLHELDIRDNLGAFSESQFVEEVSKITGAKVEDLIKNHYCNVNIRARNEMAIEYAKDLKDSGKYKIALLSNVGHDWLNKFLADMDKRGLFDEVLLSCDVAIMKPDPRIFSLMAQKLGLSPKECIMIDDKAENIVGAKQAGMNGIVFTSTPQLKRELAKILEA